MSDASAAVALDNELFIVADDENNILRVYRTDQRSEPVCSYDLTSFLRINPRHPEADIEAATKVGNRVYWITSHGRAANGEERPNRYRFFATTVNVQDGSVSINPVGIPCDTLVQKLVDNESMVHLRLDRATRLGARKLKKTIRRRLAPKKEGLNIEALAASPDGRTLYIGFRNPRPDGDITSRRQALIVGLDDPNEVIENGAPPSFHKPMLWDLKGLGIRSMEYSRAHSAYLVVAGPHDGKQSFSLYRWSGDETEPPTHVHRIPLQDIHLNPEALVLFGDSPNVLLLSDDGALSLSVSDVSECMEGRLRDGQYCLNKHLTDPRKRYFRGMWLEP
jgi:hypothetical protein